MDVGLASIHGSVSPVKVFRTGYAYLVTRDGLLVSSPNARQNGTRTLADLSKKHPSALLDAVAKGAASRTAGRAEGVDPWTGKDVVMSWSPVATGGWTMVTVAPEAELTAAAVTERNLLLLIGLGIIAAVAAAAWWLARWLAAPMGGVARPRGRRRPATSPCGPPAPAWPSSTPSATA